MRPEHALGERRPVTVLFVDVVGSTSLAEVMDPEDWAATMEGAMSVMSGAVERFGGWVASHTGDGLMALFGLPTAHEDDPARAVSAAIEMVAAVDAMGVELAASGMDFRIRVGINTGEVVARETSVAGGEPRLYGDTLNVAARMQTEAPPGGIMITAETYSLVSGTIESRPVGPVAVKGKAAPVEAYEVVGRTGTLRSVRGVAGLASPMVGRDTELARLVEALGPVRSGIGRGARVVGEPGIGKSRLLAELRAVAQGEGFGWVEARTVSYGRDLPLHLAIDLVRALCDLPDPLESIPADDATRLLSARLEELDSPGIAEVTPYLHHLLSLPLDDAGRERLAHVEPQTLRPRYMETIGALVAAAAQATPLILVCDDVHWTDDASVEVLQPLLSSLSSQPVLWVLASRDERDVPGRRLLNAADEAYGERLVDLRLRPLDPADGERLVANLLTIESLPDETRATILRRAEGNPLFVEEIIRMLIDRDAIEYRDGRWVATDRVADIEIPRTLHGLLLARIDRLPDEARRVLRVAAVIGRTFSVSVLEHVSGGSA
jgi:class 3 adenylate cyclase